MYLKFVIWPTENQEEGDIFHRWEDDEKEGRRKMANECWAKEEGRENGARRWQFSIDFMAHLGWISKSKLHVSDIHKQAGYLLRFILVIFNLPLLVYIWYRDWKAIDQTINQTHKLTRRRKERFFTLSLGPGWISRSKLHVSDIHKQYFSYIQPTVACVYLI